MPDVDNLRVLFEYEILGWPPLLIGKKYNIDPSRVCNYARKNKGKLDNSYIPTKWLCEPRWDRDRDGIEWPSKDDIN